MRPGNSRTGGSASKGVTPGAKPSAPTSMSRSTKRRQATSVFAGEVRAAGRAEIHDQRQARVAAASLGEPARQRDGCIDLADAGVEDLDPRGLEAPGAFGAQRHRHQDPRRLSRHSG